MARVLLPIGGRSYDVHCRDGEEAHLISLARRIDAQVEKARQSAPGLNEVRQLLFAAILLADEVSDLSAAVKRQQSLDLPPPANPDAGEELMIARMNALSTRIEALAQRLAESRLDT